MIEDRADKGIRWTVAGPLTGTMEIWLESMLDGVILHYFLHAEPTREVPATVALAAVTAMQLQARARGRAPVATREGLAVLLEQDRLRFSSQRAERELGATFRPLAQTLADQARWHRERGDLPTPPPGPRP